MSSNITNGQPHGYGQATNLLQTSTPTAQPIGATAPSAIQNIAPSNNSGPTPASSGCTCPGCGMKLPASFLAALRTEPAAGFTGSIALPPPRLDLLGRLSDAQRRVLFHLLAGLTEPQIAEKVKRSRHTVHDHTKAIYAALNVQRRVQLVHIFAGTDPLAILPPEDRAAAAAAQAIEPRDISDPTLRVPAPLAIANAPGYPTSVPITDAIRREAALRAG